MVRRPDTLVVLWLLLLNDHVLKARWPGPVTGKLSDLAWPVVARAPSDPPLLPVRIAAHVLVPYLTAVAAVVTWGAALLPNYLVTLVVAIVAAVAAAEGSRRYLPLPSHDRLSGRPPPPPGAEPIEPAGPYGLRGPIGR